MSSAGLVRYFDSEDSNAIQINHKTLVVSGIVFGMILQAVHFLA